MNVFRALARAAAALITPAEDRPWLLGDLDEEYEARRNEHGAVRASTWLGWQVVVSAGPLLRRRLSRPRLPWSQRMDHLLQDVRYACRALVKRPGFTFVAILTLSIAIGANTAIFSVINGVFFKPVPGLQHTEGLVEISRNVDGRFFDMSYPVITHVRNNSTTLEDIVAMNPVPLAIGSEGEPDVEMGMVVTGNYFSVLRVTPHLGRFFAADESFYPQVENVAVISHRLWERRFGADPDITSRTVRANGVPLNIIGVAPQGFQGHAVGLQYDVWVPVGVEVPGLPGEGLDNVFSGMLGAFGRLSDGAGREAAREEIAQLAGQLLAASGADPAAGEYVARVDEWKPVPAIIRTGVTAFLSVIGVIVALVLTMACTNVANMILARSTERQSEIAVRLAMGASRLRLVRQLLTEALVLFVGAGVIGLLLSGWATALLLSFQPPLPPGFSIQLDLSPDPRVVLFSLVLSMGAGILFSLAPALRATRPGLATTLRDEAAMTSPHRTRLRGMMVGLQMTATIVLLIAAGLFVRALTSMEQLDPGWRAEGVTTLALDVELIGLTREEGQAFYRELLDDVRALPGVEHASAAAKLPLAGCSSFGDLNAPGVLPPPGATGFSACFNRVTPDYFATLDLQLIAGTDLSDIHSADDPNVAVINETLAKWLWPDEDPVGREFYAGSVEQGTPFQVVGVVENAKYRRLGEDPRGFYYVPATQFYSPQMTLHVVSALESVSLAPPLRQAVRTLNADLPIQAIQPLAESLQMFLLPQRLGAWIAGVLGAAGLLLGAVGVYGVTSFAVGQRSREIGVRMALGAQPGDVVRMALRQGLRAPFFGMVVGLVIALVLSRFIVAFLPLVSPVDPLVFSGVVVVLLAVAAGAALGPARRAARTDPAATLRGL